MKEMVLFVILILPFFGYGQNSESTLQNSILTIGIYGRTECGIITDNTRAITNDSDAAEAVMDKTGIYELGTGFVYEYNNNQYVISCEHVFYKAGDIVGFDAEYNEYPLELVGSDMAYDLVVLRFKTKDHEQNFEGLLFEDLNVDIEEMVLNHIGFWRIDGSSNVKGGRLLPSLNDDLEKIPLTSIGYFESSAYLPGGFSGGPVVNAANKIIGMNTARNMKGTSYALNAEILNRLIHDIIDKGKVIRVFTGIEFSQSTDCNGVFIESIIENSPAFVRFDVLINKKIDKLNGHSILSIYDLLLLMDQIKPGDIITIELENGNKIPIKVDYLGQDNLAKISKHTLHQYSYPQLSRTEEIDNLIVVLEQGKKQIIKTAGIGGDKVYCLSDLSQLGIIIRMCALYGYIELGKDESHIYINEIKFSEDRSKRVLYY